MMQPACMAGARRYAQEGRDGKNEKEKPPGERTGEQLLQPL